MIVLGTPDPELAEALGANLAKNAVMAIVANKPMSRPVQIDVGRVHYDYIDYVGTTVEQGLRRLREQPRQRAEARRDGVVRRRRGPDGPDARAARGEDEERPEEDPRARTWTTTAWTT